MMTAPAPVPALGALVSHVVWFAAALVTGTAAALWFVTALTAFARVHRARRDYRSR